MSYEGEEVFTDYPQLEKADIHAAMAFGEVPRERLIEVTAGWPVEYCREPHRAGQGKNDADAVAERGEVHRLRRELGENLPFAGDQARIPPGPSASEEDRAMLIESMNAL
jgi:hypothetical protein